MKRLKLLTLLFIVLVSLPLSYVIWRAHAALIREESAQARFFAESLLDGIQAELAGLVQREESRSVDEYQHMLAGDGKDGPSPLAQPPAEAYIVGYLQNNPDGSFQSPLAEGVGHAREGRGELLRRLRQYNEIFNRRKLDLARPPAETEKVPARAQAQAQAQVQAQEQVQAEEKKAAEEDFGKKKEQEAFVQRYLSAPQRQSAKSYLGSQAPRMEKISPEQALNLTRTERLPPPAAVREKPSADRAGTTAQRPEPDAALPAGTAPDPALRMQMEMDVAEPSRAQRFQVEVAPLQSVFLDGGHLFLFRRIAMGERIYRQGLIIALSPFLEHLAATHFETQPLAGFARLSLRIMERGRRTEIVQAGSGGAEAFAWSVSRTFPAPFDLISAGLRGDTPPASAGRRTLNAVLCTLAVFMVLGLLAIYQSARATVDLSERRSRFVSSVTHELKTPLTNIRLYIEMLEQGVAATPEREQDYLRVLDSESARLANLINNVLELSRLEKKQRHFNLQQTDAAELLESVRAIMEHKLRQEGFVLEMTAEGLPPLMLDRDVIIQILINLIENSIKFGRKSEQRRITVTVRTDKQRLQMAVSDSGPGIPRHALKKVFDDFYRADDEAAREAGGTGIGLALVKKFAIALGGRVSAANNAGPGCTITLSLPAGQAVKK